MASALGESSVQMNCDSSDCGLITSNGGEDSLQDDEPSFEVEEDEDCGRFLVANRNISQGKIILVEKPTGITSNRVGV